MLDGKAGGWLMAEEESRLGAGQGDGAAAGCEGDGVSTARRPDAAGRPRVLLRSVLRISVAVMVVVAVLAAGASIWAWTISAGHIEIAGESRGDGEATRAPVAIVLGAAVDADGRPSPWLAHRLDTAVELYTSGRVEAILVSGDNRRAGYDEPTVMRRYLLSQGIPDQAIAVDYAGFDTYDTCVRARRIFGIERALLVTQDFHEPRAVAICRSVGLDVDGVGDSRARSDRIGWAVSWTRERAAAIKAVVDVVSRRDPTLGRQETSVKEAVAWTREHRR